MNQLESSPPSWFPSSLMVFSSTLPSLIWRQHLPLDGKDDRTVDGLCNHQERIDGQSMIGMQVRQTSSKGVSTILKLWYGL